MFKDDCEYRLENEEGIQKEEVQTSNCLQDFRRHSLKGPLVSGSIGGKVSKGLREEKDFF